MFSKSRLFTPGPVELPPPVLERLAMPMIYHRSEEFTAVLAGVHRRLQMVLGTSWPVLVMAGSGTTGVDSVMRALTQPGMRVLCLVNGRFSRRWADFLRAYGARVDVVEVGDGEAVEPDRVSAYLASAPAPDCVWYTQAETSTGVSLDHRGVAAAIRAGAPEALVCVDAVTSAGVEPVDMDSCGVDAVITAPQKGLMSAPGLALVALSARCVAAMRRRGGAEPRLLLSAVDSWEAGTTPWTPPVNVVCALGAALEMIEEEGLENRFRRHVVVAEMVRAAVGALGCDVFARRPSPALTTVRIDEADAVVSFLRHRMGIRVSSGQEHLRNKILRISHMGWCDVSDALMIASALELAVVHTRGGSVDGAASAAALGCCSRLWITG